MNDLDAALLLLVPLDGHPLIWRYFQEARARGFIDFPAICATGDFKALSDGEQGLVRCAEAVYRWKPVPFDALGHMQPSWCHHVLGVLALRFNLTDQADVDSALCSVTVHVPASMHA